MTKTFEKAQIGDRIWSPFGPKAGVGGTNGEITETLKGTSYAIARITVRFDNGNFLVFTQNGLFASTDSFPTLFWSRPEIEIPEKPRRTKNVKMSFIPTKSAVGFVYLWPEEKSHSTKDFAGPAQTFEVEVYDEDT